MITPIENNGMMLRTQDFSSIRQNEDNHSVNLHMHIQDSIDKNEDRSARSVHSKDNSDGANTNHDAKEKGRNTYFDNRKKDSKKHGKQEGVVVPKNHGGFDVTI